MELEDVYFFDGNTFNILWELMLERAEESEVNISFEMPTWQSHVSFVKSMPYPYWYFIRVDGDIAGYVSMTDRNEIGIVLFQRWRGKGIGKQALQQFMRMVTLQASHPSAVRGEFLANINPANERSKRLFKSLGFKLVQETYACPS
jgi:RimJ/RimL family protein N-acetyltransferase